MQGGGNYAAHVGGEGELGFVEVEEEVFDGLGFIAHVGALNGRADGLGMIELQSALVDIRAIGFADVDAEYDAFELKFFGQRDGQIAGENNLHDGGVWFVYNANI